MLFLSGEMDGQLESFKQFVNCLMVIDRKEVGKVRRLAVSEGLFVERESDCIRTRTATAMGPSDPVRVRQGAGAGIVSTRRRSGSSVTELCLREFWGYVRTKFSSVQEVLVVGRGQEHRILSEQTGLQRKDFPASEKLGTACADTWITAADRGKLVGGQWLGESFHTKVARAVDFTESEHDWRAPSWRVLSEDDKEATAVDTKIELGILTDTVGEAGDVDYLVGRMMSLLGQG